MNAKPFKLAMIQMEVKGGEKAWNVHHAVELIAEAASNKADVVLLPECMDLGWTHPSSHSMAEEIPDGAPCQELIESAKMHALYVCAGLTEKSGEDVYNSAILIDKQGQILCKHRKLHELDIGHPYYAQGDRLNVAHTEFGTFGLMICADGFARNLVLTRSLGYMGADVILSPCAWAVDSSHDNHTEPYGDLWRNSYMPVAKEFSLAIFGVSNVGYINAGLWQGKKCIGCSLAINSLGEEILQGPYGVDAECILYVDVMPTQRPARGAGWDDLWRRK